MKNILKLLSCLLLSFAYGQSQELNKESDLYKSAPNWAKLMYSKNPNVNQVDQLYVDYFNKTAYVKSYHTQYYKRWRRAVNTYLNNAGNADTNQKANLSNVIAQIRNSSSTNKNKQIGNWSPLGPFRDYDPGGVIPSGGQANVYAIGRCAAFPNVMYCGTEPGEVYKSIDSGNTWTNASKSLITAETPGAVTANVGINALAVHPTNSNTVYIGAGSQVYKTQDGGLNWNSVFTNNLVLGGYMENPAELHINTSNPQIVMVAGKEGIYRTSNGGTTWTQVLSDACFDIKAKPGNPNTLYTIRINTATNTHQFLKSTNAGLTWMAQSTGWYTSTNAARYVNGARIAVSAADSNRVYAFLIGDSKPGDNGFIGVYASNNGGTSWANTMGYDGSPYLDPAHPNLISSSAITNTFSFNQGFYNCAIIASNTNANELLVGGIGMWRSTDGGVSFQCIYNYTCGNYNPMHVDMQDFRAFGNEYWATTDGGIYKSTDLFNSQPQFKMNGINATDFWGFGSGWNRDILVGGTFHNGVDAFAEGFPSGSFLNLVGGEPASGYVNPGNQTAQSRVYSTSMGSRILPQTITGPVLGAPFQMTMNEDAWFAESSEMEFHPSCYNHIYLGDQNKLYKSTDGGASFSVIYTASPNTKVLGIEVSRVNTNTMYIVVRPTTGNAYLVKTTNDWVSNSIITALPSGGNNLVTISIDPENDQIIWMAYPRGANGNKVFKSINGGTSWTNETSSSLDAQTIQSMQTIGGTNGGIYIATNLSVYYKNNTLPNWTLDNTNLPASICATGIRPFYRDGKIRLASYGKGIWESPLYETPTRPVAKIMVDKLSAELSCNVFYFDDYSMLNHTNATWAWTFQNANISTSSIRNPQVTFNTAGNHMVILTVTDANQVSSTDTLMVTTANNSSTNINQNFETALLSQGWYQASSGNLAWSYNNTVGGFGQSSKCMSVNNFVISQPGVFADMIAPINMSAISPANAKLTFDVAYAFYAANYADTLQVLVSTDCGVSYTTLYSKGGLDLGTAPPMQNQFLPTAAQWRKDTVDLSAYIGNSNVFVIFRNINSYGQALYVDNINLVGQANAIDKNARLNMENTVFPNPVSSHGFINIKGPDNSKIEFNLFNTEGKSIDKVFTNFNTRIPLDKYNLNQGTYFYKIVSNDKIINGKLVVADRK
jgi:Secretion system C-terminal sorting domain